MIQEKSNSFTSIPITNSTNLEFYGTIKHSSNIQLRFYFETNEIQQKPLQIPTIDSWDTNYYQLRNKLIISGGDGKQEWRRKLLISDENNSEF